MAKLKAFWKDQKKRSLVLISVSGVSLILSFFNITVLPFDIAWVAVLLCGLPILWEAGEGLIRSFDITAGVLVSIALIAAVIVGEVFAAGEVAFIMTVGELLEARTVAKARAGIEKLIRLTPRTARVVRGGETAVIPASEVKQGDVLRVLAGETVAADGVILSGNTSIDQSVMTGEALPVDKTAGDEVFSGTVNQYGTFDMSALCAGECSFFARVVQLVKSADARKARVVSLADKWAKWLVIAALASAAVTWVVTGEVIRAVTILVVFCPCALVLATPTAMMAGIGNAARHGILVKDGAALERLAGAKRMVFDKTGTLTLGKPHVVEVVSEGMDADALLALAASAELRSEHPLGKAIAAHYMQQTGVNPAEPESFTLLPGKGVEAVTGGKRVLAGNEKLLRERGISPEEGVTEAAVAQREDGATIIWAAVEGRAAGFIALADTLREDAADAVAQISALGIKPVLLTGDSHSAAARAAKQTGIQEIFAECLPEGKLALIEQLEKQGERVCMVGDGVNDAPALRRAYVGVAMGGIGSDIAVEAADIALIRDDIGMMPHLAGLAKSTMRTIWRNLSLSMALNAAAVALAMMGLLNPVTGALVHNAGSLVVVISSALLLRWKRTAKA